MKTNAQQDTWAAAYNAALMGLLAGRAHGEFDPSRSSLFLVLSEHPKGQSCEHCRPDQPIASLLKSLSQIQRTFSMAGCVLDLSIHPAVLGGSLRFCEQPATRLKARSSSDKDIHVKVPFMDEGCFASIATFGKWRLSPNSSCLSLCAALDRLHQVAF
jgi:hypothetical protein